MDSKLPEIVFSKWHRWSKRDNIEGSENPGVYLLAKFKTVSPPPSVPIDPLQEKIIYIGETCRSLHDRWNQFHRSAFENKEGHSGGYKYREEYCGDRGQDLFVTAFPVSKSLTPDRLRSAFIRFVERKLILEFAMHDKPKHKLPNCNSK